MKFSEALVAIKALDNGSELASAIEGEVEGLKAKNYEVIGEKRNATTKAQTLESTVMAIAKAAGIEGDLESILTTLEPKVRESLQAIATKEAKLTELETRATEAEGKIKTFERQGKLTEIATKAGANAKALERLLGDRIDELTLDGEVVKLGDKPLKEFVEADESLKDFLPALFPAESATPSPSPSPTPQDGKKLPGGTPGGKSTASPVATYTQRAYGKRFSK